MSRITYRPYQREAIDATMGAWDRGVAGPAIVLPPGLGKTVIFSGVGVEWLGGDHGQRMVVLAHREELLKQAARKFADASDELTIGMVASTRNECWADVVCANVATLGQRDDRRRAMIPNVGLVVVDEAHHAVADSYKRTIDYYVERGAKLLGVTATMGRSDERVLGSVWTEIIYHRSFGWAIGNGYLVRPRGERVKVEGLDLSKVKSDKDDYQAKALGDAMIAALAPEAIARALRERCPDKQGIVFAPSVAASEAIAAAIRSAGFSADVVHGKLDPTTRALLLKRYEAGEIQWLVNCMVLTEGTDLPCTEVVVIARPTASASLYVQMVGRGLRLYCSRHAELRGCFEGCPGRKLGALILDVVGATGRHRLASPIDLFGDDSAEQRRELKEAGLELDDLGLDLGDPKERDNGRDNGGTTLVDGPLTFTEVDMFRSSAMDWSRTDAGVWFIPAGDRLIALFPGVVAHTWDVVAMHKSTAGTGQPVATGIPDQAYARAQAEALVTPHERTTAARDRSWKKAAATDAARRLARQLGFDPAEGARASEVSQLITQRLASRRIDPRIPFYAVGRL